MALETPVTFINTLNALNPTEGDQASDGDNHLRNIKSAIKTSFPNITGAVTATHTDLNTRLIPSGCILLWSGSVATIPAGWYLCNGVSGTPNLMDRFVVGAGLGGASTYTPGMTGGAATVALATGNLPAHTHTFSDTSSTESVGHTHNGTTGAGGVHEHTLPSTLWSNTSGGNYVTGSGSGYFNQNVSGRLTGSDGSHTHAFTTAGVSNTHTHAISGTTSSVGSGTAHENRPPYYALCYIMKL